MYMYQSVPKPNVTGTRYCVQNRQVFGLDRLNEQRFPTLRLYLMFVLYRSSQIQGSV